MTSRGALVGFWTGVVLFILIHAQIISRFWPDAQSLVLAGDWFEFHARSPYSAATMAAIVGVAVTILVSLSGEKQHVD